MAALLRNPRIHLRRTLLRQFSSSAPAVASPPPRPEEEEDESSMATYRKLKHSIKTESDPEKISEIFIKSSDHPRFFRDRSAFDITVQKLSRLRRSDLIERILEHQKHTPLPKYEGFWIRIMMLYSQARMFDQALRIFDQMESQLGCKPTHKSFSALLSVCFDNHRYDLVHEYFESIPAKLGVSPSLPCYNIAMRAFCEQKDVQSARSLIEKMQEKGMEPGVFTYNVLLSAYLRDGEDSKFDQVLKEVLDRGLEPTLVTYNLRIIRLCKSKECVRAKKLVDEMASKGIKPNLTTFNALIDGYCKIADFKCAIEFLEVMRSVYAVFPNCESYGTLIRHLVKEGEFESALEMCKQSIRRKWVPPFSTMETLVNGLVKISKADEAKEIVEKMKPRLRGKAKDSWTKVEGDLPF